MPFFSKLKFTIFVDTMKDNYQQIGMSSFSRFNYFAGIESFVVNQQIIRILNSPKHQFYL